MNQIHVYMIIFCEAILRFKIYYTGTRTTHVDKNLKLLIRNWTK